MKLFVYGTLRRGEAAHGLLQGAPLVASVWSEPVYRLVDLGGYPALVDGGSARVRGEIYEIDASALVGLDAYEDCPALYQRVERRIAGHEVVVYVLDGERVAALPDVIGGDWCARDAAR